ncbi:UNVERIFIED_CONTAM: hypothetical protein RKD50_009647 [Streptomyces canus]|jgi:hypothetical protein
MRVPPIRVGARFSKHIEHGRITLVVEHRHSGVLPCLSTASTTAVPTNTSMAMSAL